MPECTGQGNLYALAGPTVVVQKRNSVRSAAGPTDLANEFGQDPLAIRARALRAIVEACRGAAHV